MNTPNRWPVKLLFNFGLAVWMIGAGLPAVLGEGDLPSNQLAGVEMSEQPGHGQLLNIDFGKSPQATPKTGRAAIGLSDRDLWNTYPNSWQNEAHIEGLKWSDGTATAIGYDLLNGPGNWGSDLVADSMYADYAYSSNNTVITLAIRNLPSGTYHFYVYAHGAVSNQNSAIYLAAGPASFGPFITTSGAGWQLEAWQEGAQYAVFRSIPVEAGQTVTLTSEPSGSSIAVLNGVQIWRVSEAARSLRLLNLDFGKEQSAPHKKGKAAAGISDLDYWNTFANPYQPELHVSRLKWADGIEEPVGFDLLNAPGNWGSDMVSDLMYSDYAYPHDNRNITLVLRQLPADFYDFYVYAHGAADDQNSAVTLSAGSQNLGPRATVSGPEWKSPEWQDGRQYVLFSHIRVRTNQNVVITIAPDHSPYALLNGVQINRALVPLPDPYDGISPSWRATFFGPNWASDPDASANADPDEDGAPNQDEYIMGTNPLDAHSVFRLARIRLAPVIMWASTSNYNYQVVWKQAGASSEWTPLSPVIRATNDFTEFVDLGATNHLGVYRVKVLP